MALDRIKFNIASFNDTDAGGNNYYTGIVYEVFNSNDTLADIYSDAAGANPINQDGISNKSNSSGEAIFYIDIGSYYIKVDSKTEYFDASNADSNNFKYNPETLQDAIDYDGWDVNGGEVFATQGYHEAGFGKGDWITVLSSDVTTNDYNIRQFSGVANLAAVLNSDDINPLSIGAYGDGVTDDTGAISHLDSLSFDKEINLLGRKYSITVQPSNNKYFNGSFIVAGKEYKQIYNTRTQPKGYRSSSFNLKKVWADSRYRDDIPDGLDNAVIWLGDSISHGAYQGNLYQDGIVNIIKRCIRAETGVGGYGHAPMLGWSTPIVTTEVHDAIFSGSWVGLESTTGGEDIMQGLAFVSSTPSDSISFTVPTFQEAVRLWYVTDPSGGIFEYSINGGTAVQVDTSGARDTSTSTVTSMLDNGFGQCEIVVTVVSGTVTFCGIGYETGTKNNIQNFSQSGRRLEPATEQMLDYCCRGASLVLALGHNDYGDAALDPTYAANFNQRVDWIIEYCIKYNTSLFVVDMCWWVDQDNPVRVALRRAAQEAQGTYIGLPDYLTRDDFVKAEYSTGFYQVDASFLFSDTSHPNADGAMWIAQAIASDMGLSVTSKKVALDFHDYPFPLQLVEGQGLKNTFDTVGNISKVSKSGQSLNLSLRISRDPSGGGFPTGTYSVSNELSASRQVVGKYGSMAAIDRGLPLYNDSNALVQHFTVTQGLAITMGSVAPWLNTVSNVINMNSV